MSRYTASREEREEMMSEKVPALSFANVRLSEIAPYDPPRRTRRNSNVLTTSTCYGLGICGKWHELRRGRKDRPSRYIARADGASVWMYDRMPEYQEQTSERLYFGSGAVVEFQAAPDPTDGMEVIYRVDQRVPQQ